MNIKNFTASLMLKFFFNQPLSQQSKIFEDTQSCIDDAADFSKIITNFIEQFFEPLFSMLFSTKSKAYIDWLSLIVFIPLPVVVYNNIRKRNKEIHNGLQQLRKTRNMNLGYVGLAIQRNHLIKSYDKIDYEINEIYKMQNQVQNLTDDIYKQEYASANHFLQFVILYRQISSYFVIIKQVYREVFNFDMAQDFLLFVKEIYDDLYLISAFIRQYSENKHIFTNVIRVFSLQQENQVKMTFDEVQKWLQMISTTIESPTLNYPVCNLEFSNVNFAYNDNKGLIKNFSQLFSSNKCYAITGKTGCGKSTLSNLAIQLVKQQSGEIKINNENISELNPHLLRQIVTVCSQNDPVIKEWTLKQNIQYGEHVSNAELEAIMQICDIDFAQLETVIDELSGGQKQRVSLSRALCRQSTRILILDETTSALDDKTEAKILLKLKQYCQQRKILLIFIAHKQHVINFVDEVVTLSPK